MHACLLALLDCGFWVLGATEKGQKKGFPFRRISRSTVLSQSVRLSAKMPLRQATQPKILQSFLRLFTTATNASESVSQTSKLGLVAAGAQPKFASDETDTLFHFSNALSTVV